MEVEISLQIIFVLDTFVHGFSRRLLHQASQSVVVVTFAAIVVLVAADLVTCDVKYSNINKRIPTSQDNLELPPPPFQISSWVIVAINVFGLVFLEFTSDACYLCTPENYPTEMRAIGLGMSSFAARVGASLAPQVYIISYSFSCHHVVVVVVTITASVDHQNSDEIPGGQSAIFLACRAVRSGRRPWSGMSCAVMPASARNQREGTAFTQKYRS